MLRDKNLIPLSRQHQHALALSVRIDRASPIADADRGAWQAEIVQHFQAEIKIHFAAEEQVLFPAARKFTELIPLVEELLAEHSKLREYFEAAENRELSAADLKAFAHSLAAHIRKEERQLFERLQEMMSCEALVALGEQLNLKLEGAVQACILPALAKSPKLSH
jgi:hemerythrin-like domain-containing protein